MRIDIHVHPATPEFYEGLGSLIEGAVRSFGRELPTRTFEEIAAEYASIDTVAVLLAWDAETATGYRPVTNDYIATAVKAYPDRFVGFASVDPKKGRAAIEEVRRSVQELGLKGVKLHPGAQGFYMHDEQYFPLWDAIQDLNIPVLVHVGTTALGAGVGGGGGIILDHMRPTWADVVAARFPNLDIICAHGGWPWQEELIAMALHKANIYIDISGWPPRYLSPDLIRQMDHRLQDKVLFGTDYPFLSPAKLIDDFNQLALGNDARQKILYGNAARLLDLK